MSVLIRREGWNTNNRQGGGQPSEDTVGSPPENPGERPKKKPSVLIP